MKVYIDLGNEHIIDTDDIVAIIDLESALTEKDNAKLLLEYEEKGDMIFCTEQNFVKSYVFCDSKDGKKIYSSSFTSKKLKDRLGIKII